ncbi:MAG: hypothetical protein KFKLKKLM_02566 [Flavobacteriales bacterium]|nr:hypothetical protein [Flavobacteriales bacterium]
MKTLYTLSIVLMFWVFPNIGKAQLLGFDSTSINMGSLPDTINLNDNYVHTLTVHNFDSVGFTGTIYLVAAIDSSGTLLSVDTVGSVFVSNLGWTDTVSITYTENYNTINGYKLGDNIVVVWPVAGSTAIRDTIRKNVFISNSLSIQRLSSVDKEVIIYPNPFNQFFEFKIVDKQINLKQVRLYDIGGRIVINNNRNSNINTENLTNGIYFLELEFMDRRKITYKLIKK